MRILVQQYLAVILKFGPVASDQQRQTIHDWIDKQDKKKINQKKHILNTIRYDLYRTNHEKISPKGISTISFKEANYLGSFWEV